jgi:N-acetylglucosamine kinase-like BadF-type ATPase
MNGAPDSPLGSDGETGQAARYVLGVDGGGTKTEAWLARLDDSAELVVLGRAKAGPSNPIAVGFDAATENLRIAIDAARQDAGLVECRFDAAVLALSGAGHASMRRRVVEWCRQRDLAALIEIVHDADPVLVAGTPDGYGVALIVGTGSAAIAADGRGRREVVGGWGYWYGDEGSAYWIGRRALQAVAHANDGRAEPTALTPAICQQTGAAEPRAILGLLEQTGNVRGAIARLATAVAEAADFGDPTALAIIDDAAEELAAMVACAAAKLQFSNEFPLALTGGVACGSELLRRRLVESLEARHLRPNPVQTVAHPAAGCVALAGELLFDDRDSQ